MEQANRVVWRTFRLSLQDDYARNVRPFLSDGPIEYEAIAKRGNLHYVPITDQPDKVISERVVCWEIRPKKV